MSDPAAAPTIECVKTLIVELPPLPPAEALKKFVGRVTYHTVKAAARIAAKPRTMKVPGHLLRQLWRLTGGWQPDMLRQTKGTYPGLRKEKAQFRVLALGDLEVRFLRSDSYDSYVPVAFILFRGQQVLKLSESPDSTYCYYEGRPWLAPAKVKALFALLPAVEHTVG